MSSCGWNPGLSPDASVQELAGSGFTRGRAYLDDPLANGGNDPLALASETFVTQYVFDMVEDGERDVAELRDGVHCSATDTVLFVVKQLE